MPFIYARVEGLKGGSRNMYNMHPLPGAGFEVALMLGGVEDIMCS